MVNFNGSLIAQGEVNISLNNRSFKYGDGVFESMKFANGKLLFWEDHYFRLMSSMRILRMEIPMNFSPEFLEEEILKTIQANNLEEAAARIRFTVYRAGEGFYAPQTNTINYLIECQPLENHEFVLNETGLKVDLFKDYFKQKGLLSNLKTANSLVYVLAGIFKSENNFDECILLNDAKEVVEAISANIFVVKEKVINTPPLQTGCLKGVMRKNIIKIAKEQGFIVTEEAFSPFELQRADEVFLTNASKGVQWVGNYKKKNYSNAVAVQLANALNQSQQLA